MRALFAVSVLALGVSVTLAAETQTAYGVGLLTGLDSNPLFVTSSAEAPDGALFQVKLDGSVISAATPVFGVFATGTAWSRLHDSDTADASHSSGSVRAGFTLSPGSHRLLISSGGHFALYRGTFTDRETGQVYEATVVPETDPITTTSIADRLNHATTGIFVNTRFKQNDRISLFLEASMERTNYLEDYQAETGLDPLDFETSTVKPGISVRAGDHVSLSVSVAWTDLGYDARPALDMTGATVPGTLRSYRYTQYQISMRAVPAERWTLWTGFTASGRDDTYAGYYDNATQQAYLGLDRELGPKSKVRVSATMHDVKYDNATITGLPDGEINESEVLGYSGRFERKLNPVADWFVETGTQSTHSRDPVFTHERDWVHLGIQFRR